MEADALARRRAELTGHADERSIDWKGQLEGLPTDDDGLMVAALASLLGLDIQRVFDVETRLGDLERDSLRLRVEKEVRDELVYGAHPHMPEYGAPRTPGEGAGAG
jgi:hypothetical protein